MDIISKLQRNPKDVYQEATRLLIKIAENILKDPLNQKLRTLQKSNATISGKILNVFGGVDCLLLMGFQDRNSFLTLPVDASLEKLKEVKEDIIKYQKLYIENNGAVPQTSADAVTQQDKSEELIKKIELPPFHKKYDNKFLNEIAYRFHIAQIHDNKDLQDRARELIPIYQLEVNALENLRVLQKEMKKGDTTDDLEVTLQDMLILELLNWFKNDFFTWVDSPPCENCKSATKFSHMSDDVNLLKYTDRVEMHRCQACNALTPFPRYNDLNILMATRKGRCGEWANCFTLFCRTMGWDSRHVIDETDHVWTEVYSIGQKRWLHCDPCENVCDTPLMYESGWNKQVSYVIAYSGEEIQDVTWRYTSNHKEVLTRRTKCTEGDLMKALLELRSERQKNLSESRKKYLVKRLLDELCELLVEKKPNDKDKKGRSSGSLAWRLARGEQKVTDKFTPYIWKFSDEELTGNVINIRYFTALDHYEISSGTGDLTMVGWLNGVSEVADVFRMEEKDWKKVYLSRTEEADIGKIKWSFEITNSNKVFDTVEMYFDHTLYQNGNIQVLLSGDTGKDILLPDEKNLTTKTLSGSCKLEISATLTGGKGDIAWQHAQLFRQETTSEEPGFTLKFTFKDK